MRIQILTLEFKGLKSLSVGPAGVRTRDLHSDLPVIYQ